MDLRRFRAHRPLRFPSRSARGQSLVEFGLILPILLIMLLGVSDFGRVFQAGIVNASAARAAAEAAALEYLRTTTIREASPPGDADYYERVHEVASEAACTEARILANTTYSDGECADWPAVLVCIHDGLDPLCDDTPEDGYTAGPAQCALTGGWSTDVDSQANSYVEVRTCYRFTTLFNLRLSLPFGASLNLGEVYLRERAAFTVANY